MLATPLIAYIQKMFKRIEKPQTYGSALEAYIVSHNPQSTYDVEALAREFEEKSLQRSWLQ